MLIAFHMVLALYMFAWNDMNDALLMVLALLMLPGMIISYLVSALHGTIFLIVANC
jgi:hypothetical protein